MIKIFLGKIKLISVWLLICLVLSAIYCFVYAYGEPKAYDFMTSNVLVEKLPFDKHKKVHGSDDIVLIVIDAKSVEKYRWPWKREVYCEILDYFTKYSKPKVFVHDSIFATLDKDNPESDAKYFKEVNKMDNLVTGFWPEVRGWQDEESGAKYDAEFEKKFSVNIEKDTEGTPEIFGSQIKMPKPYFDVIKNIGSIWVFAGFIDGNVLIADEVYRTNIPFIKYKGAYYPSLSMKTFLMLNNPEKIILNKNEIEFPDISYKVKQKRSKYLTVTPIKFYKLYKNTLYSHKSYSAMDVIDSAKLIREGKKPILPPELFNDKIIILGAYVPAGEGLNDKNSSPVSPNHPGMDFQATSIDNLIHNDFLNVIPQWINVLITILGMFLVYAAIRLFNLAKSIAAVLSLIIGYIFIGTACFYYCVIINILTPVVMFVLTTIFAYTNKYVIESIYKEKVQTAMGKYMSNDVMRNVVQNIDNLGLGGKKAVVTVLFADIRGFTSISEKMSAQQVSEILNEYFSEMEPIITGYNGIINKFIGDAILAIFGEPIQDENHASNAVKCAYAMLKKVEQLHKKWAREDKPEIEIGIGINTGEVFIGNIGSDNRMEYTVIGDTVNLASRLESYNKVYRTKILISSVTYKSVRQIADVIKIPDVQIRGKSNKIDIYDVLKVKLDI